MVLGFELVIKRPEYIFWIISFLGGAILISIFGLFKFRLKQIHLNFLVLPLLFFSGAVSFFIFLQKGTFQHFYILGVAVFLGILLYNESKKTIKNPIFEIISLLCAFLLYSSIFGLYIFLPWPSWALILAILAVTILLAYQSFWFAELINYKSWLYIFILGLIQTEITWALLFWPIGFIGIGLVLFAVFYIGYSLVQFYLKTGLNKKLILKHLVVAGLLLLFGLATAQWKY